MPEVIKPGDRQDWKSNILTPSPVCFYHIISVKIPGQKLTVHFIFLA